MAERNLREKERRDRSFKVNFELLNDSCHAAIDAFEDPLWILQTGFRPSLSPEARKALKIAKGCEIVLMLELDEMSHRWASEVEASTTTRPRSLLLGCG